MNTPGKEAYNRSSAKSNAKPQLQRKKAALDGSDARSAYVRKKQGSPAAPTASTARQVKAISSSLRARLSGVD